MCPAHIIQSLQANNVINGVSQSRIAGIKRQCVMPSKSKRYHPAKDHNVTASRTNPKRLDPPEYPLNPPPLPVASITLLLNKDGSLSRASSAQTTVQRSLLDRENPSRGRSFRVPEIVA